MYQPTRQRKCTYASRGCTTRLRQEKLSSHLKKCGFAPVQCSLDGCEVTVNRQDAISHHENCEFRWVTCEECDEEMKQRDYEEHVCVLRKKLAEMTKIVQAVQGDQVQQGSEFAQCETTEIRQVVTRKLASTVVRQPEPRPRAQRNRLPIAGPSERHPPLEGEIVVAGGLPFLSKDPKSYEIFDWSTQQWTLFQDALFYDHTNGFSFFYDNKVMFCGGNDTNRVECLDIANYRTVLALPVQLPDGNRSKGVLCGDKMLTFDGSVSETSLQNPFRTKVLAAYDANPEIYNRGIARVNDNMIFVVGGSVSVGWQLSYSVDNVLLYNPSTNVMKTLAPLPYGVRNMAVVAHGDNIIILGGDRYDKGITNEVLVYNITEQHCSKLPSMLEKRSHCAAVIMGDTIVVFGGYSINGGEDKNVYLKTAEYLVLGENKWKKLRPMHYERMGATACVLPWCDCVL